MLSLKLLSVLQTTASEATFVCLLAGRTEAIRRYREQDEEQEDAEINSRLVAYCSDQVIVSVLLQYHRTSVTARIYRDWI
jgi:histidine decarboxylase